MPYKAKSVLIEPLKPIGIPSESQWLAGEGAGSWFNILSLGDKYLITRYSPKGQIECEGLFEKESNNIFNIYEPFEFTYLSHCRQVKIIQNDILYTFNLYSLPNEMHA